MPALSSGLNNKLFGHLISVCCCFKTNQYRQINVNSVTNFRTYWEYFWVFIQGEITRANRQTRRFYVRNSAMSFREVGQDFCLAASTVRLRLEMWCKKIAFMSIRAANRTGTLCVPVIGYILSCDFVVAESIKNNFNSAQKQADQNYFPQLLMYVVDRNIS